MRIALDTNVLLVSIPKKSPYRVIFDALLEKGYTLLLTNEILTEYEEIITLKTTLSIAQNIVNMLLSLNSVEKIEVYFKWNLIEADADDNKFSDCAIAGNADFLVTQDRHFDVLKTLDFPKINILTPHEFIELLQHPQKLSP
jgi:uncharacterized protein